MNKIKHIERITNQELDKLTRPEASWHWEYRHSAYVFIGGLSYQMTEGDIAIVFSQFGEVVDLRLQRDKTTGKSLGFCFIAYEDQRSTILAVDNFNGSEICGRPICVDHVKNYKIPKEYYESESDEEGEKTKIYKPTGPDGNGWGDFRKLNANDLQIMEEIQPQQQPEKQKDHFENQLILDPDQMWEK